MDLGEGVSGPEAKKSQKSLEKVSRARGPESLKKVSKKVRKVKKNFQNSFFWLFGPFSRLFSDFRDPGPGRLFRDFFETFWLRAPRLLLPGPRNLKISSTRMFWWDQLEMFTLNNSLAIIYLIIMKLILLFGTNLWQRSVVNFAKITQNNLARMFLEIHDSQNTKHNPLKVKWWNVILRDCMESRKSSDRVMVLEQ